MTEPSIDKSTESTLHLFAAHGIEVEYMIVDGERLDVAPKADLLLEGRGWGAHRRVRER